MCRRAMVVMSLDLRAADSINAVWPGARVLIYSMSWSVMVFTEACVARPGEFAPVACDRPHPSDP